MCDIIFIITFPNGNYKGEDTMSTRKRSATKKSQGQNSDDRKKRAVKSTSEVVTVDSSGGTPNLTKEPYINNSKINSKGAL